MTDRTMYTDLADAVEAGAPKAAVRLAEVAQAAGVGFGVAHVRVDASGVRVPFDGGMWIVGVRGARAAWALVDGTFKFLPRNSRVAGGAKHPTLKAVRAHVEGAGERLAEQVPVQPQEAGHAAVVLPEPLAEHLQDTEDVEVREVIHQGRRDAFGGLVVTGPVSVLRVIADLCGGLAGGEGCEAEVREVLAYGAYVAALDALPAAPAVPVAPAPVERVDVADETPAQTQGRLERAARERGRDAFRRQMEGQDRVERLVAQRDGLLARARKIVRRVEAEYEVTGDVWADLQGLTAECQALARFVGEDRTPWSESEEPSECGRCGEAEGECTCVECTECGELEAECTCGEGGSEVSEQGPAPQAPEGPDAPVVAAPVLVAPEGAPSVVAKFVGVCVGARWRVSHCEETAAGQWAVRVHGVVDGVNERFTLTWRNRRFVAAASSWWRWEAGESEQSGRGITDAISIKALAECIGENPQPSTDPVGDVVRELRSGDAPVTVDQVETLVLKGEGDVPAVLRPWAGKPGYVGVELYASRFVGRDYFGLDCVLTPRGAEARGDALLSVLPGGYLADHVSYLEDLARYAVDERGVSEAQGGEFARWVMRAEMVTGGDYESAFASWELALTCTLTATRVVITCTPRDGASVRLTCECGQKHPETITTFRPQAPLWDYSQESDGRHYTHVGSVDLVRVEAFVERLGYRVDGEWPTVAAGDVVRSTTVVPVDGGDGDGPVEPVPDGGVSEALEDGAQGLVRDAEQRVREAERAYAEGQRGGWNGVVSGKIGRANAARTLQNAWVGLAAVNGRPYVGVREISGRGVESGFKVVECSRAGSGGLVSSKSVAWGFGSFSEAQVAAERCNDGELGSVVAEHEGRLEVLQARERASREHREAAERQNAVVRARREERQAEYERLITVMREDMAAVDAVWADDAERGDVGVNGDVWLTASQWTDRAVKAMREAEGEEGTGAADRIATHVLDVRGAREVCEAYADHRAECVREHGVRVAAAEREADEEDAGALRGRAHAHRQAEAESFAHCDTDGAVSQWAHGLNGRRDDLAAEIVERGGVWEFRALFDLDGVLVPAREVEGRFGTFWSLLDADGERTGETFNESNAKTPERCRKADARRGYYVGRVLAPAKAVHAGGGQGLAGAASVQVIARRTDGGFSPDVVVVDNGHEAGPGVPAQMRVDADGQWLRGEALALAQAVRARQVAEQVADAAGPSGELARRYAAAEVAATEAALSRYTMRADTACTDAVDVSAAQGVDGCEDNEHQDVKDDAAQGMAQAGPAYVADVDSQAVGRGLALVRKAQAAIDRRTYTDKPGDGWYTGRDDGSAYSGTGMPFRIGSRGKAMLTYTDDGRSYLVLAFDHSGGEYGRAIRKGLDAAFAAGDRLADGDVKGSESQATKEAHAADAAVCVAEPPPVPDAAPVVDVAEFTLTGQGSGREGIEPYRWTVAVPGAVGEYSVQHDCQGNGGRGVKWLSMFSLRTTDESDPTGEARLYVRSLRETGSKDEALGVVAEHAMAACGDVVAALAAADRMNYAAGLWVLPDVGEGESIVFEADRTWTITSAQGFVYRVSVQAGCLAADATHHDPLKVFDFGGVLVGETSERYERQWPQMLDILRDHSKGRTARDVVAQSGPVPQVVCAADVVSDPGGVDTFDGEGGSLVAVSHGVAELPSHPDTPDPQSAASQPGGFEPSGYADDVPCNSGGKLRPEVRPGAWVVQNFPEQDCPAKVTRVYRLGNWVAHTERLGAESIDGLVVVTEDDVKDARAHGRRVTADGHEGRIIRAMVSGRAGQYRVICQCQAGSQPEIARSSRAIAWSTTLDAARAVWAWRINGEHGTCPAPDADAPPMADRHWIERAAVLPVLWTPEAGYETPDIEQEDEGGGGSGDSKADGGQDTPTSESAHAGRRLGIEGETACEPMISATALLDATGGPTPLAIPHPSKADTGRTYWDTNQRVTLGQRKGRTTCSDMRKGVRVAWDEAPQWLTTWEKPRDLWAEGTEPTPSLRTTLGLDLFDSFDRVEAEMADRWDRV